MMEEYKDTKNLIKILEEKDIIKEYNTYVSRNEKLLKNIDRLIERIKEDCPHESWYHLSTSTDDYEGRTYYNCKCLDCGLVYEDRAKDFKNVVFTKKKFDIIQKRYKELKAISNDPKLVLQLLEEFIEVRE